MSGNLAGEVVAQGFQHVMAHCLRRRGGSFVGEVVAQRFEDVVAHCF